MIIIPDRTIPRAKVLLPQPASEWRTSSQAQPKNSLGQETVCRFTVTARTAPFGKVVWRGWFDDREDFDIFLWASVTGNLRHDRYIQRLPRPEWHPGLIEAPLWWEHHVWWFITGPLYPTTTTWPIPPDCTGISGLSGEFLDAIGSGGSGGARHQLFGTSRGVGGGGGAWARVTTLSLTPSATLNTSVPSGGAGITSNATGIDGNNGADCWANKTAASAPASTADGVLAKGGLKGPFGNGTAVNGGLGGASGSCIGASANSGGRGGNVTVTTGADSTGGGAAASLNGVGGAGVDNANTSVLPSAGGSVPSGAAGSAGVTGSASSPGGDGTEYDSTHGSGAGSGSTVNTGNSGRGGNYGGGAGGYASGNNTAANTGNAGPALLAFAYTPTGGAAVKHFPNLAMMGF